MRTLALILFALLVNTAAADYYECTTKASSRWSGTPCEPGEKQRTYDSQTKQLKRDASTRPRIGMTADQARELPDPWGRPKDVNRTGTIRGTREQWVYEAGKYERAYLYFENDVLTGIQAPDYMR